MNFCSMSPCFLRWQRRNCWQIIIKKTTFHFFVSMWISVIRLCYQIGFKRCNTAISLSLKHDCVTVVREDIDLLVLVTALASENVYFHKWGRVKIPNAPLSKNCFKCKNIIENILFIHDSVIVGNLRSVWPRKIEALENCLAISIP